MNRIITFQILSAIICVAISVSSCKNSVPETETKTGCAEMMEQDLPLPDTAFPSIANLDYNITIFDSVTSGEITNITDAYSDVPGIFTFRGNSFRNTPFCGHIDSTPTEISIEWIFRTGYDTTKTKYGIWGGGNGWTGQPLYVEWNDTMMQKFRKESDSLTADFDNKELIISSLCGKVYFLNYETGKASRKPIDVHNPINGTAMLDPHLNGNLYIGQGIPREQPFGALIINLFKHEISNFFPQDPKAWKGWNAYDASPLIIGDFLIRIGENGTVYKFHRENDKIKLHSTLRYHKKNDNAGGMEASMAVYKNYGYTTDNHGNILCINLNNLKPVWLYDNHDDTDASPVLDIENGIPYLYSGCEMDRQGLEGISYLVKLNALTGELVWEQQIPCKKLITKDKHFDGGMFSTMLLGSGNCDSLLFTTICINEPSADGKFYAINKKTGEIAYSKQLKHYAWSSPVAIMNNKGEMMVLVCDCIGNVYIIDGKTGEFLITQRIGINFESSPIIIDNHVVIGSRGTNIYKLTIR